MAERPPIKDVTQEAVTATTIEERPPIQEATPTEIEQPRERPPIVDVTAPRPTGERPPIVDTTLRDEPFTMPNPDAPNWDEFSKQSGIDDNEAGKYEDALLNSMAFDMPASETMNAQEAASQALSNDAKALKKKEAARNLYESVSVLGDSVDSFFAPEVPASKNSAIGKFFNGYKAIINLSRVIGKTALNAWIGGSNQLASGTFTGIEIIGQSIQKGGAIEGTIDPFFNPEITSEPESDMIRAARKSVGRFAEDFGASGREFYSEIAREYAPPAVVAGKNVVDNPELLIDPVFWIDGIARTTPSMVAAMATGLGAGRTVKLGGETLQLAPKVVDRLYKIAIPLFGGGAGGALEGAGVHEEAIAMGKTPDEARSAYYQMTLASGALNAFSLNLLLNKIPASTKGKVLSWLTTGKIGTAAVGAVGEGIPEGLEEIVGAFILDKPISDAWKDGLTVALIAAVPGAGTAVISRPATVQPDKTMEEAIKELGIENVLPEDRAPDAFPNIPPKAPELVEDDFSDLTDQIEAGEITEDEAVDSIISRLIEPVRGEEGAITIDTRDTVTISGEQFNLSDPAQRETAIDRGVELFRETGEIDMLSTIADEIIQEKLLLDELGEEGTAQTVQETRRKAEIAERGKEQEARLREFEGKRLAAEIREQEIARGLTLFSETGQIDLTSPVSLDIIKARITNEAYNVRDNFNDVLDIGRSIFAEGKVKLEEFTARIKEVLGEAWEKIKPYLKTAWDVLNNERGAIEIGPEGKPVPPKTQIRKATGQVPIESLVREDEALREGLRKAARAALQAAREGKRETITSEREKMRQLVSEARERIQQERNTRKGVARFIRRFLPPGLRGQFIEALAAAKTPTGFSKLSERIDTAIVKFEEAQKLKKNLATQRQKLGFIRKIGEFNQTVINEIKQEVGLTKPLTQATEAQLSEITDRLKARLRFKRSRGFNPQVEDRGSQKPEIQEVVYKANRNLSLNQKSEFRRKAGDFKKAAGESIDKLLGTISSRLADINPSLRQAIRRFEFKTMTQVQKDRKAILPFLEKAGEMSKEDHFDFDLAVKNGDTLKINELIDKYDMKAEYDKVRTVLDDVYERAQRVGFDIGYRQNYFPRQIKDTEGFLDWFNNREDWSIISEAIQRKEMALGRSLNPDEKVSLINTMIRGYSGGNITLSETGAMKQRIIDFVSPELNQFYEDSLSSLSNYISQVDEAIEQRVFFGKSRPIDGKEEEFNNLDDSIGFYITDLIAKGQISPSQEKELRQILQARFGERGTSGAIGLYKNLSYLTLLGSPLNAVTQLGDMAFSLYAGGPKNVLTTLPKALIGKSVISKEDIGIEKIAAEVENKSRVADLVDRVFRIVGLTQIDTVGKETLINSVILKYQKIARNEAQDVQSFEAFESKMQEIFGDETAELMDDLRNDVISENVKYLAFNELLNFQPIALSEVPEVYLKAGNGRIFYALKTWTLKMLDVYRNEVFRVMRTDKVQGVRNMLRLSALLVTMNATADVIKSIMKGEDLDDKDEQYDILVDNILKLIGFSRYSTFQARRDGIGSAVTDQITPPTNIIDDISKDVVFIFKDSDESFDVNKLRSIKNIPVIGQLYYWWFGRAAQRRERKQGARR
jgi:hypothetical protein